MNRNIVAVMDEMLVLIPTEEETLRVALNEVIVESRWKAPEDQFLLWNMAYEALDARFTVEPTEEWAYRIIEIFTTKDRKDIQWPKKVEDANIQ